MSSFTTQTSDGIARLELNLPGEPVNKISRTVRKELESVLDSVASDSDIRAVVLISGKPESFIAGADIDEFVALGTREEALALVERGQELINRMENLGNRCSPLSMAGISGEPSRPLSPARIASPRIIPKRCLACPRSSSGSSPLGGCQRLPQLIGARAALDIILAGRRVPARAGRPTLRYGASRSRSASRC